MPTGYTAKLAEGEQSFEEFVLRCARAMGALIMMRDEPFDAPIPERFEPSDYYPKRLQELRADLARVEAMSLDDAAAEAFEERRKAAAYAEQYEKKDETQKRRYQAMRARVAAWQPPTPDHQGFRVFMLEQLDSSIKFDCSDYRPEVPPLKDAAVWKAERIAKIQKDVAYCEEEERKEIERTEERNRWVAALRDSLRETVAA